MQIFDIPINSKRMETTRIGTFDFPLAVHKNDLKKNVLGFVNWHWHYEFQLTYVVRGTTVSYTHLTARSPRKRSGRF